MRDSTISPHLGNELYMNRQRSCIYEIENTGLTLEESYYKLAALGNSSSRDTLEGSQYLPSEDHGILLQERNKMEPWNWLNTVKSL